MKLNDALPRIQVDPETYVVTADGEELSLRGRPTCCRSRSGTSLFLKAPIGLGMSDWLTLAARRLRVSDRWVRALLGPRGRVAAGRSGRPRPTRAFFSRRRVQQAGYAALPLVNDAYRSPEQPGDARRARRGLSAQRGRQPREPRPGPGAPRHGGDGSGRPRRSPRCEHARMRPVRTSRRCQAPSFGARRAPARRRRRSCSTGQLAACCRRPCGSASSAASKRSGCSTSAVRGWIGSPIAASALSIDDLAQTAPLLDLLQAGHDRLYSRLFQS